jgi:hypothetical protein
MEITEGGVVGEQPEFGLSAASAVRHLKAMKGRLTSLTVLGLLAILFCGYFAFEGQKPATQRWEYRIEAVPDATFQEATNKLGADGWELVFARRASNGEEPHPTMSYEMIFKRPMTTSTLLSTMSR